MVNEPPHSPRADADTEGASWMGVQPTDAGSLILEDIGTHHHGDDPIRHKKKGKFGPLFFLSLAWLGVVLICAAFADFLPVQDPNKPDFLALAVPPFSEGHILGTDKLGRDILARLVYGARVSVIISVCAVTVGIVVGGALGLGAGYLRGKFEGTINFGVNVLLAFPGLILLLALVAFIGQSLFAVTAAVAFLSIPTYTRVSRASTLAVSQREFVLASKAMGAKKNRILFKEIAPNVLLPVVAFGLLALGTIIILEASLAYLGLSVELPQATWGGMIADGRPEITSGVYYLTVIPSLVLFFTVFSLNYVGDGVRNRYDVRESQL
jgi:peptide/nickel transport system permease protein